MTKSNRRNGDTIPSKTRRKAIRRLASVRLKPPELPARRPSDDATGSWLIFRNINIDGRRTSLRLEPEVWDALEDISRREGLDIHKICTEIDLRRPADASLTSAVRVFALSYFRGLRGE